MNFVTYLVILVVSGGGVSTTYAVTNSTQDYYISTYRKLNNDIAAAEKRVAAVVEQANEHIKVFQEHHETILQEIRRTEERFTALQTISETRKYCVQKYKYTLVSVTTASSQFASCITTSQKRINTLTEGTKTHLADAKANANSHLPRQITNCNTANSKNETKLEECVIYQCDYYSNAVDKNLKNVDKSLDESKCTTNDINKDTIKCSFVTENTVLVTIGTVTNLIDNCIIESEKPPCCSCSTTTPQQCPTPIPCPPPTPCPTPTTAPPSTSVTSPTALPASVSIRSIFTGARARV